MTATIYDGLPTLATLAFHGLVDEPQPVITEADLDDPEARQADLDDLADAEDDHGDFDPDQRSYDDDWEARRAGDRWERSYWGEW